RSRWGVPADRPAHPVRAGPRSRLVAVPASATSGPLPSGLPGHRPARRTCSSGWGDAGAAPATRRPPLRTARASTGPLAIMPAVRDKSPLRLSVVVPVYNERLTLPEILERVQTVTIPKEIIVVDDCSTDGTRDFLRALEAELAEARRLGT